MRLMTPAGPNTTPRDKIEAEIRDGQATANELNRCFYPRWMIFFGDYNRWFAAFPCWPAGPDQVIKSGNAADLVRAINDAEGHAHASPPTAVDLLPRCPDDVAVPRTGIFQRLVGEEMW